MNENDPAFKAAVQKEVDAIGIKVCTWFVHMFFKTLAVMAVIYGLAWIANNLVATMFAFDRPVKWWATVFAVAYFVLALIKAFLTPKKS